jgi:hypothetical protein
MFSKATSGKSSYYVDIRAESIICNKGYLARLNEKSPGLSPGPFGDL